MEENQQDAKGTDIAHGENEQIEELYTCMNEVKPLTETQYTVMMNHFNDYIITGGMPEVVSMFIDNKTFSGILNKQKALWNMYLLLVILTYRPDPDYLRSR